MSCCTNSRINFERPMAMRQHYPAIFEELKMFYHQDPLQAGAAPAPHPNP